MQDDQYSSAFFQEERELGKIAETTGLLETEVASIRNYHSSKNLVKGSLSNAIDEEYRTIDVLNHVVEDFYRTGAKNSRVAYYHTGSKPVQESSSIEVLMTWDQILEAEGNTSFFWSSFNLMNDVLSAAVVSMPYLVNAIGIYLLIPAFLFFAIITQFTLDCLYHLSRKYRITSYPELCQYALGTPGYLLICFLMFIFNFGTFLGGMMIVGSNLPRLLEWILGFDSPWLDRSWVLVYTSLLFLPISFFKKISDYKINSLLSVATLMALGFMLLGRAVIDRDQYHAPDGAFDFKVTGNTIASLGGISFLFVCHDLSFGVFLALESSNRRRWSYVVTVMLMLTNFFFLLTGLAGWFMFYDDVESNIMDNFGVHDTVANIGRLLLTLNILISVPYNMFMPRFSLYALLSRMIHIENKNLFHILTTFLVMGITLGIAEVVTNLGQMFELVGGVSAVGLAYIMPSVLYLKLEKGAWWSPAKLTHTTLVCLGTLIMLGSTFSTLYAALA